MGEPIKIVLQADTDEAVASLRDFLTNTNAGLKQLSIGAKASAEGLTNNRMAMMELGHVARSMSEGLAAGISPARMLAMELPRVAQAASMSGINLASIKTALAGISPLTYGVVAGLAAMAGAAALAWHEFSAEEEKARENHNELVKSFQALPGVIGHINEAAKAGLLSPETSQKLLQNIGAIRGELTKADLAKALTTPGPIIHPDYSTNALPPPHDIPSLFGLPAKDDIKSVNEELVTAGLLLKEIGKDGDVNYSPSDKGQALLKIMELRRQLAVESVSGYDKERAAAKQSYDAQLESLNEYIERANSILKPGEAETLRGSLAGNYDSKVTSINFAEQEENQKKAAAAFAESQQAFSKIVSDENQKLEQELNLSAAQQGKTREQIYQEEFTKRMDLATRQIYSGEIGEQQYTAAVQEASIKRLNAITAETNERNKLHQEMLQMSQDEARQKVQLVLSDPKATQAQKTQVLAAALSTTRALIEQNTANQAGAKTDQERIEFTRQRMTLDNEYTSLLRQQQQEEERINQARLQGVQTMFGNMATAAKSYGDKGMAAYRAFAIAQATMDTAQAAIAAYKSVVGIPYVGPVLAPIAAAAAVAAGAAQITQIESAGAREHGGDVEPGMPYMTGERGREIIVPTESSRVFNADDTARLLSLSRNNTTTQSRSGSPVNVIVHFNDDPKRTEKDVRDNPKIHHVIVDVAKRSAQHIQPAA